MIIWNKETTKNVEKKYFNDKLFELEVAAAHHLRDHHNLSPIEIAKINSQVTLVIDTISAIHECRVLPIYILCSILTLKLVELEQTNDEHFNMN